MGIESHLEGTRYGWLTPAYLAGLDADVVIWCARPAPPGPGCRRKSTWGWEALMERLGPRRDLWLAPWRCPACGGREVAFTLLIRDTHGGAGPAWPTGAASDRSA